MFFSLCGKFPDVHEGLMIKNIHISKFKCLTDENLELRPLTILTGKNSSGKSSVLQAILIAARNCNPKNRERMYNLISKYQELPYLIDITHNDTHIICTNDKKDETDILTYEDTLYFLSSNRIGQEDSAKFSREYKVGDNGEFLFGTYSYIMTDNISFHMTNEEIEDLFINKAPKDITIKSYLSETEYLESIKNTFPELNDDMNKINEDLKEIWTDENIGDFIASKIKEGNIKDFNIMCILNAYFSYITEKNIILKIERIDIDRVKVYFQQDELHKINPFNLGAGMSYLAKILILCFLAKPGDVVMIENPEIHLHPKAQSRLGELFAFLSGKGIQFIIETHCEHLLDSLRYQIFKEKFSPDDVIIYYKDSTQLPFEKIGITSDGHFAAPSGKKRAFPKGFFDASLDQLLEIG